VRIERGGMTQGSAVDDRKGAGFPLSFSQERLWLEYLLEPLSPSYNLSVGLRLRGIVDVRALELSLTEIVRRHDILRTRIVLTNEEPRQQVRPPTPVRLAVTDLSDIPQSLRWERAMTLLSEEAGRPFDLGEGPVFRTSLVKTGDSECVFLFVVHHIAFDGWSRDVFLRELSVLYESFAAGKTVALPDLPLTYADFAVWQRELVGSEAVRDGLAYWRDALRDYPQVVELPSDHPHAKARSSEGHTSLSRISLFIAKGLKSLARTESTTLYVTLLAAFVALLNRYSGQDDIVVGTAVAGRTRFDLEEMMGFFVNTIPLRVRVEEDPSFRELVRRVRSAVMGGLAHQDVPLEKLIEELHLPHDLGRPPLFQLLFNFETFASATGTIAGIQVEMLDIYAETAMFDLTLTMREDEDGLLAMWEYSTKLFEEETVRRMAAHLSRLLEHVVNHPDTRLSDLPLLGEEEKRRIVVEWNTTYRPYPRESRIHELFEEQVDLEGGRVALARGNERMTYTELNQRANQLARWLRKEGVGREVPVGICLNRSLDLVVAALGILKAGGAYIPLDPEYPQERIGYIVEDTSAPVIITNSRLAGNVPDEGRRILCLDEEREKIAKESTENLQVDGQSDDLAYVMYTSGSTGKPKGVCVIHRGVVRLVKGNNYASLGPAEVFLLLLSFAFDGSVLDIWGSLLNGSRLIISPGRLLTHHELGLIIREEHVTTLNMSAELFQNVVDASLEALSGVRQLFAGGNVLSPQHAARFKARYPDCTLVNVYGPTENTTWTTCYEVTGTEAGPLPIGRPIANTTAYVLDKHLKPVPVGVVGELCTGGDGLARGYLNDQALTAERFVSSPLEGAGSPVLYRTGDLARYRADGVIIFEGRRDNQVKVSGFRVETEEVEAVLRSCPGVAQVTVVARFSPSGDKQLVAYCVPTSGMELTAASLRAHMQERVPGYMVPSLFVSLPELPLNAQGKVDRHALPEPEQTQTAEAPPHVPARDSLESTIASIWKRLFAIDSVGIHDNFFDLGGHSLLAFRFFAALEKATGAQLPLATLFEAPTIEQLATIIREKGWRPPSPGLVPIKPGGSRRPIFFVHAVGGNLLDYYDLARSLPPDQPAFGLQARGLDGKEPPLIRVEDMAEQYVKEIGILQPHGPYALGGYSSGGIVAFEMARQLVGRGETITMLALLDTFILADEPWLARARYRAGKILNKLLTLPPREKLEYTRRSIIKTLKRGPKSRNGHDIPDGSSHDLISEAQQNVMDSMYLAARNYSARKHPYPGTVTLFLADELTAHGLNDPVKRWKRFGAGTVEAITVPGTHLTMMAQPHVGELAQRLDQRLDRVNRDVPNAPTAAS
jgi:amino acid adenylation domain-containing protein